ncbi:MAG: aminotransferase class I/II-fold pyridoxal phosphate-dependent enzyme [Alphaproteobacteria bacterium]|nr:aminotransferase class I/II-fold pyridoxal phosphate-dependent enzyme [Alphaproteobacteria bacterium]MBF0247550.1 aminotransferase class I/II-fold pyridoxal phosphate-dependent enzyme [Alphaproteobacteria bacterium]
MDDARLDIALALANNEELESKFGDGDEGNFLSGWQCENPFASALIKRVRQRDSQSDPVKYSYMEMDEILSMLISDMHRRIDGRSISHAFPSPFGSTSIIFTFCANLARNGVKEVHYIPPIYFSMHFALKLFGIIARPVSGLHAYERGFTFNLPEKRTVLALVDPVWFTGKIVPVEAIKEIVQWQQRTGSLVFVDGSFQYMPWAGDRREETASLDPAYTFRMICPTKIMAVHGYRFSYVLMPSALREQFANTFTNIYASSTISNVAFAHEAVSEMERGEITASIIERAKNRFFRLIDGGWLKTQLIPESGYFTFSKITAPLPQGYKLMTQEFFEQRRFNGYAKLNLVSPSFHLIDPDRS